jgi:RNA recognition motif-containing protein
MGWERYSMVPLPDSMMSTTVFVGNLCEFVDNNDLSELFRSVSGLSSVPSVVVRKPDTSSMRYGFVSFPTVQEKEVSMNT